MFFVLLGLCCWSCVVRVVLLELCCWGCVVGLLVGLLFGLIQILIFFLSKSWFTFHEHVEKEEKEASKKMFFWQ